MRNYELFYSTSKKRPISAGLNWLPSFNLYSKFCIKKSNSTFCRALDFGRKLLFRESLGLKLFCWNCFSMYGIIMGKWDKLLESLDDLMLLWWYIVGRICYMDLRWDKSSKLFRWCSWVHNWLLDFNFTLGFLKSTEGKKCIKELKTNI